jgi:16S rRNA (uracil1498-N3)-methyltransferase
MPSFYLPDLTPDASIVVIRDDEHHHLARVTRHAVGDEILLNNGVGLLARAVLREMGKRESVAEVVGVIEKTRSQPGLAAAFSPLRLKHDHLIVEKLTELGVRAFFPVISTRTVQRADSADKYRRTALTAIKQCDNAFLPEVFEPALLEKALDEIRSRGWTVWVASEVERDNFPEFPDRDACLLIGPEGGFTEAEFDLFRRREIPTFTLGNHVLRAETAAIAAAALWMGGRRKMDGGYY